ncbi:MAG TPA: BatD family protein [Gemmatirosa sp.]
MRATFVSLACAIGGLAIATVARAQVTVAVSAPANVPAHTPVLVRVEVNAPAGASVRLSPPAFAPFTLTRTDRAPTDTAGLRGRQRLEWRFVLLAGGAGTFAFEPFEADVSGPGLRSATFRSLGWSVAVQAMAAPGAAALPRADLTATDPARLEFDAHVAPDHVYVGEQTTLELRVGVGARVRERLRRSPEFAFPTVAGVVSYDLSSRHASSALGDVHVYRRALFPVTPGTVDVPPAQLVYALTPEGDPFGVEDRVTARTPLRHLVAVAPPTVGRPAEWDGAVGRFRASARVDTTHARVGDALLYTLRVEGTGNVLLLPRPPLDVAWADVATAGERVAVDSSGELAGGSKEFDWLLTPRAAGRVRVPGIRYAYFDPRTGVYAFADALPIALRVASGAVTQPVVSAPARRADVPVRSELGVVRRWDGARGAPFVTRRAFWFALAGVPAPAALWLLATGALGGVRRRRDGIMAADRAGSASTDRARATAALGEFRSGVSRLLGGPGAGTLDASTLARGLRRAGISRALADECTAAADRWARAAYGTGDHDAAPAVDAPAHARDLLARVAHELEVRDAAARGPDASARPRAGGDTAPVRVPRPAHAGFAVGLALLVAAVAAPQLADRAARSVRPAERAEAVAAFDAGVAAYAAGDAARARDLFAASAAAVPAAPAAWFNAGTAAWAVADTAGAAFAWQRAAHLAPRFPGVRARLERLPVLAAGGHLGAPPPIDPRVLGAVALAIAAAAALWLLATAVSAARAGARPGAHWSGALACYLVAVACAGAAAIASRALDVRGLAVVRAPATLRPDPSVTAIGVAPVVAGEVAELVDDEGGWRRVRLDGDREGWLRAAQVAPLADAPSPGQTTPPQ